MYFFYLAVLITIVLFLPINIQIVLSRNKTNLSVHIAGLRVYKGFPSSKKKRKPGLLKRIAFLDRLLPTTYKAKLSLCITVGTGDAAQTALICGSGNILLHSLSVILFPKSAKAMSLMVRPEFSKPFFDLQFKGIISLAFAHIIVAAVLGLFEQTERKNNK